MIVATAGHVDHGKTSLVRQLTGVDTDRLPEEKKRGLSIDLGFAYLTHPENAARIIGFVDVPGHEKFVKNMIAGVGSISLSLWVVAADDGLMPQSIEHLAILQLLGITRIVPVITKTDLVSEARVAQVSGAVQAHLAEQGVAALPLFCVSMQSPESIDPLRHYLFEFMPHVDESDRSGGHFRLAVDRCFSVSGAGTVVTGTVLSGAVMREDSVYLPGRGEPIRVRSVRAQSAEAQVALVGQRCALNLAGGLLRKRTPVRGDCLTSNPHLETSVLLDVDVTAVDNHLFAGYRDRPVFGHWTACHLHIATTSTTCRVALLKADSLAGGASGFARIYCDKPISAVAGDRFVLRDQSARHTIAGGHVIDPHAPQGGRSTDRRIAMLTAMNQTDAAVAFRELVEHSPTGLDVAKFAARYNCRAEEVADYAATICGRTESGMWVIGDKHWAALCQQLIDHLDVWHNRYPLLLGASDEQLSRRFSPRLMPALATALLDSLVEDGSVIKKGAVYRLKRWTSTLDEAHESHWSQVKVLTERAGRIAPRVVELAESLGLAPDEVSQLLNTFVAHGRLYRVSSNRYYLPGQLAELAKLCERLAEREALTVAAFRDESSIGRNLVVELLEFFDRCQFTRRTGAIRRVLRPAETMFA